MTPGDLMSLLTDEGHQINFSSNHYPSSTLITFDNSFFSVGFTRSLFIPLLPCAITHRFAEMSTVKKLRVPVISWKPGFVEAVLQRVRADPAEASPARALLESGNLELVVIPVPEFPPSDAESKVVKWG